MATKWMEFEQQFWGNRRRGLLTGAFWANVGSGFGVALLMLASGKAIAAQTLPTPQAAPQSVPQAMTQAMPPTMPQSIQVASACGESDISEGEVYTADTVCSSGLTRPSLWWIREQLEPQLGKKLVSNWKATPRVGSVPGQVTVVVNPQAWSLLDYFERYEFLHAFGLAARDFGYETEVQDSRGIDLASYRCEGGLEAGDSCRIRFGGSGSGFRGGSRRLF